jgi:hypothetical protein
VIGHGEISLCDAIKRHSASTCTKFRAMKRARFIVEVGTAARSGSLN